MAPNALNQKRRAISAIIADAQFAVPKPKIQSILWRYTGILKLIGGQRSEFDPQRRFFRFEGALLGFER